MNRRLMLLLAFALVAGLTCAAYAEVQNVKVSGDITAIGIARDLGMGSAVTDGSKSMDIAGITRVRIDADLTDNVMTTVRLLNERYWGSSEEDGNNTDMDLDLAYVTLKEFLYSPVTLMVGRQELHFGNDMIVGDRSSVAAGGFAGVDADLSVRKSFDAIRVSLNYDPLVVDLLTAKVDENDRAEQDDIDLYGINANYALSENTVLEGYYFGRYAGREQDALAGGSTTILKPNRVDTVGARFATAAGNLSYQAEVAYQMGKRTSSATNVTANRKAFAAETAVGLDFKDKKYAPSMMLGYAYFSGDKGKDNKRYTAWDPMFENQTFGHVANAQFPQSNAHIAMVSASMKPADDVTVKSEMYAFWWDKEYMNDQVIASLRGDTLTMEHKKFAGSEIDLTTTYDYTEDVQLNLLAGVFVPGGAFSSNNDEPATEVLGSMKVTF